jgi:membrane fusion protein, multidrug efflux system
MRVLIWILMLVFFGTAFFLVMRHRNTPQAGPGGGPAAGAGGGAGGGRRGGLGGAVPVTTETAKQGDIGIYIDAIGTVTPVYTSSITSQATGIVTDVHYREGQLVSKGTPLIDIDSRPYRATLAQAQGVLQRDQGLLAQAEQNLERYRAAWARNAIPRQQLDDQEKVVEQVKGTVAQDQGTVQADEINVQFCHIVSPITGRIGLRLVDPGNVVQANSGTQLAVVTQLQPITVVFTVAEDALNQIQARVRKGAKLTVEAYDRTNQNIIARGTLLSLDNQVDTTTGTVKARASFTNADSALFPNAFVNIRLLVDTVHNATLIPADAIQHNGQESFVYTVEDNRAHTRPITVHVTEDQTAQVEGVDPGDVLVTSGFDKLQDGAQVTNSPRRGPGGPGGPAGPGGRRGLGGNQPGAGQAPAGVGGAGAAGASGNASGVGGSGRRTGGAGQGTGADQAPGDATQQRGPGHGQGPNGGGQFNRNGQGSANPAGAGANGAGFTPGAGNRRRTGDNASPANGTNGANGSAPR